MATKAVNLWRSVSSRAGASRRFATASTAPRMKPFAPTADAAHHLLPRASKPSKGDFVPVYVALGLILLSLSLGANTAKHQIAYNPHVRVHKKRRETVPEVYDPDRVVHESDKFVSRSLFRKVAHLQDFDAVRSGVSDPTRADRPRRAETLKSVGVDPSGI